MRRVWKFPPTYRNQHSQLQYRRYSYIAKCIFLQFPFSGGSRKNAERIGIRMNFRHGVQSIALQPVLNVEKVSNCVNILNVTIGCLNQRYAQIEISERQWYMQRNSRFLTMALENAISEATRFRPKERVNTECSDCILARQQNWNGRRLRDFLLLCLMQQNIQFLLWFLRQSEQSGPAKGMKTQSKGYESSKQNVSVTDPLGDSRRS